MAPSKPPSAIFPLLFIQSHSVKREGERGREGEMEEEEEDMVRSRKPLSFRAGKDGGGGGVRVRVCEREILAMR